MLKMFEIQILERAIKRIESEYDAKQLACLVLKLTRSEANPPPADTAALEQELLSLLIGFEASRKMEEASFLGILDALERFGEMCYDHAFVSGNDLFFVFEGKHFLKSAAWIDFFYSTGGKELRNAMGSLCQFHLSSFLALESEEGRELREDYHEIYKMDVSYKSGDARTRKEKTLERKSKGSNFEDEF